MQDDQRHDAWEAGQSYETFMGRWSSRIAHQFLDWLGVSQDKDWADIGCGTGALTRAVLEKSAPRSVSGVEPSPGLLSHAASLTDDPRARFAVGGAEAVPLEDDSVDVAASGLVLNFVPDRLQALKEMKRILRPGGTMGFYVWDYPGGGMGFLDAFWKAAAELDPKAAELDEGARFAFCSEPELAALMAQIDAHAEIAAIEQQTEFATFDDFFTPFTLGAGPAPGYYASLDAEKQETLRSVLAKRLGTDGPLRLPARAWAVKATV
ncbi:MAG: methyltransferase domain-containing protein [Paracoccaceae bacterium]